jgi:beta-phosphoglucomutase-like phosphatase (HAD superfamily)
MPAERPAAVLWDMDGTLIDSEPLWGIALQEVAHELGGAMSDDARTFLIGRDLPTSVDVLLAEVGRPPTPGLPTALVTNTVRRIAEMALDGIGRGFFDVVVCGDDVAAGKPAPDPYLRAAELLGVAVADCVAVEDSPDGALSADRAGAAVLVVPSEVPVPGGPRRVHRADLVGLTVQELAGVLRGVPAAQPPPDGVGSPDERRGGPSASRVA